MRDTSALWLYRSWPWWLSLGLLLVQFLADLWLVQWVLAALFLAGVSIASQRLRSFMIAGALITAGAAWGSFWGANTLDNALPPALIKQDVWAIGMVQDLPQQRSHALRFKFRIEALEDDKQHYTFKGDVLLNWYKKPYPDLKVGEQWRLKIRLKPAHGSMNPGGFNYEQWLFSQRIRATGYVRDSEMASLTAPANHKHSIDQLRTRIEHFVDTQQLSMGGILKALAIGVRNDISDTQWQVFRDTGTAHLIAISGLHIGLIAGIAYFLAYHFWRYTFLVRTLFPAQHIGRIAATFAALIYAALAGFSLPTQRAFLMLIAYFALSYLRRNPGTLFTLGFILMLVLIVDPLAALGAGLWLSFGAVAAIAYAVRKTNKVKAPSLTSPDTPTLFGRLKTSIQLWSKIQLAVFVGLLPFMLLFFGQFSIISLFANFIAIPFIGMLIVPCVLLAAVSLSVGFTQISTHLFAFANGLLELIWPLIQSLADLPFSVWLDAAPPGWAILLGIMGAIVFLNSGFGRLRLLGLLGFIPLFLPNSTSLDHDAFEVQILDVGQGLSVVVITAEHALLYDAGIKYDAGFDAGAAIVMPFLRQRGIHTLDVAIASHQNIDHYGGIAAVIESKPDIKLYSSAAFLAGSLPCIRGTRWQWDGVTFSFIHPQPGTLSSDNNDSCVLKISSQFGSILLTGDIEREAEKILVANGAEILQSDVLLAPHHGSKSSSTNEFIAAVKPKLAVFSAGYLNRFKHPDALITQRYADQDIATLNTATGGAIKLVYDENGLQVTPWRSLQNRYWLSYFDDVHAINIQTGLEQ